MVIGMAVVYFFLIALMLLIIISSRLFKQRTASVTSLPSDSDRDESEEIVAVVTAAISRYRSRKKG